MDFRHISSGFSPMDIGQRVLCHSEYITQFARKKPQKRENTFARSFYVSVSETRFKKRVILNVCFGFESFDGAENHVFCVYLRVNAIASV